MAQLLNQGRLGDWLNYPSVFPTTLHIRLYSLGFAVLGRFVGFRTLAAEPLNLIYYISILVLTCAIGTEVFGPMVGRASALMVALWPSLLLHTTQLLRDPLFISAMLLLLWMTILCIRRELSLKTASALVGSAVFAVLVILLCRTDVKEILTVVLLMAVAVCIITQVQQHRFRLRNVLGLLVIVTFTVLIPPLLPARNVSEHVVVRPIAQTTAARENSGFAFLESFARRVGALRHKFIVAYPLAGSNVDTNVELNSALDLLRYLPRAAELGFFAPFPRSWVTPGVQVGISGRLVAGLEMCVMYFMFGLSAVTLIRQRNQFIVWFLFILTTVGCVALGYVVANISALYRMRYTFFIPVLILGIQGLIIVREAVMKQYERSQIEVEPIG